MDWGCIVKTISGGMASGVLADGGEGGALASFS